jgi:hypothetical protein
LPIRRDRESLITSRAWAAELIQSAPSRAPSLDCVGGVGPRGSARLSRMARAVSVSVSVTRAMNAGVRRRGKPGAPGSRPPPSRMPSPGCSPSMGSHHSLLPSRAHGWRSDSSHCLLAETNRQLGCRVRGRVSGLGRAAGGARGKSPSESSSPDLAGAFALALHQPTFGTASWFTL